MNQKFPWLKPLCVECATSGFRIRLLLTDQVKPRILLPILAWTRARRTDRAFPCSDQEDGSTSGGRGLTSFGGLASSTCDLRSAAFSIRTAANSGFFVKLANLRSVIA